jgi:hypothetical protein
MQTREEAMANHPSAPEVAVSSHSETENKGPYAAFFDAIAELELVVEMYGTASPEADLQRAVVRLQRQIATQSWRSESVAA